MSKKCFMFDQEESPHSSTILDIIRQRVWMRKPGIGYRGALNRKGIYFKFPHYDKIASFAIK